MPEKIILIDEKDNVIGSEKKLAVHQNGLRHRAFSIYIFNRQGQMLIQQRAFDKYHSGGLWSNSCCSHQRENEELENAIHRRLEEELGFDCKLEEAFAYSYRVEFENGLIENELDHVFFGEYNGKVKPNRREVTDWKWIDLNHLEKKIRENPGQYSYWFKKSLKRVINKRKDK